MTREGSFDLTNSQEQAILHDIVSNDPHNIFDQYNLDGLSQEFKGLSQEITFNEDGYNQNHAHEMPSSSTMDSKMFQNSLAIPPILNPIPTPILGKEEFPGNWNFQLILNHCNSGKHWVYSEKLQKVFIHMEEVLPLQFSWNPPQDGFWVRATMIYKLDQHRSQPVTRCPNHMAPDNNSNRNIDPRQVKHVIRCLHKTSNYEEAINGHLSVLTPLGTPEPGVQNVPMDFVFYCKNSCTSGMNRRATELIFTLETESNQILGRRKLEVRVCSCPKRDKEKEENEMDVLQSVGKKRKTQSNISSIPPGKKMACDNKPYGLHIKVVGRENANAILKYAYDLQAGAAMRTGNYELYRPYMEEIAKNLQ